MLIRLHSHSSECLCCAHAVTQIMSIFVCALRRRLLIPQRPPAHMHLLGFLISVHRAAIIYSHSWEQFKFDHLWNGARLMRFGLARPAAADQKALSAFRPRRINKNSVSACQLFSREWDLCAGAERRVKSLCRRKGRKKENSVLTFSPDSFFWQSIWFPAGLFSNAQIPPSAPSVYALFTQLLIFLFQSTGNILNFCEVGLKISGKTPIVNQAVIQFPDTSLTSVTIATVERHTVAFLGTKDGRLKKVSCMQTDIHLQQAYSGASNPLCSLLMVCCRGIPSSGENVHIYTRLWAQLCALGMHARVLPRQVFQREPSWALINHLCAGGSCDGWNLNVDALDGARSANPLWNIAVGRTERLWNSLCQRTSARILVAIL